MTVTVLLKYKRQEGTELSEGSIVSTENGLLTEESTFTGLEFRKMLASLSVVLSHWPEEQPVDVLLQRTDHAGLVPYVLDAKTVELLRKDPVAAIQAMEFPTASPSGTVRRVVRERVMAPMAPIQAGHEALADSFGDVVYFKVRKHELECPGCGFWGLYVSPGLLADKTRVGAVIKTAFVCPKKCKERFLVTCQETLGYVDVEYLLNKTRLDRFYFPRAWNEGQSWVSRETLQRKYDEYVIEKENIP